MVFLFLDRKVTKVGAILVHNSQDTPLNKEQNKIRAGDYVSALLVKMIEDHLPHVGVPSAAHCSAIDSNLKQCFSAPAKVKTMFNHMTVACQMIKLMWESVPIK